MSFLIFLALMVGIGSTIMMELAILTAFFSPVKWNVLITFNDYNEGILEMVLIPAILLFQIIISTVYLFRDGDTK